MSAEARRCGIAIRLLVERILLTKISACFTTDNPAVVRAEMPDRTVRYVDIEVGIEVGGPAQVTIEKPVLVYKEPEAKPAAAVAKKATTRKKAK